MTKLFRALSGVTGHCDISNRWVDNAAYSDVKVKSYCAKAFQYDKHFFDVKSFDTLEVI